MHLVERILPGTSFGSPDVDRWKEQAWFLGRTTYNVLESWFCLSSSQACKEVDFTSASCPKSVFQLTVSSAVDHASTGLQILRSGKGILLLASSQFLRSKRLLIGDSLFPGAWPGAHLL